MKARNKILLLLAFLLILINGYYYIIPLFKDANEPLNHKTAEVFLHSKDLIYAFKADEKKSTELYAGKILEVTGTIKEINHLNDRTTIILNNNDDSFGIICDINPLENEKLNQLKINQKISVKGICKGFLKDVILLNCSIEINPNE